MESFRILGGVPVFRRPTENPSSLSMAESPLAGGSPNLPPGVELRPVCITAERNVPLQITAAWHRIRPPDEHLTATRRPSSTSSPSTWSTSTVRPDWVSIRLRASDEYQSRSFWQRGDQTAGPLDLFSILKWIPVVSAIRPISPPRASTSRTRCPFAVPPIAGLQDIRPIAAGSMVIRPVAHPILADARAASIPACPPPITITENRSTWNSSLSYTEAGEYPIKYLVGCHLAGDLCQVVQRSSQVNCNELLWTVLAGRFRCEAE